MRLRMDAIAAAVEQIKSLTPEQRAAEAAELEAEKAAMLDALARFQADRQEATDGQ